jgi:hypothetical protein
MTTNILMPALSPTIIPGVMARLVRAMTAEVE